jgi:AraC-like DNA-binding protein
MDNISFIAAEVGNKKEISTILIENSILEILVAIFRMLGMKENDDREKEKGNAMIALAKQYIDDNVTSALGVADVAAYCYLSTKQLTRLFKKFENISPGEYIIKKRVERIEAFLADSAFSLKQISAKMNFENEYYFNAFFKKHSGMPPGEYKKMLGQ